MSDIVYSTTDKRRDPLNSAVRLGPDVTLMR